MAKSRAGVLDRGQMGSGPPEQAEHSCMGGLSVLRIWQTRERESAT